MTSSISLFDPRATHYIELIDQLGLTKWKTRYTFTANEDFKAICIQDTNRANQIYWEEMLARTHLAAAASILRNRQWVSAVISAATNKNLLAFAAALRGLIESSADSATALGRIGRTLSDLNTEITRALDGKADRFFVSSEMEDELIHYSHGRELKNEFTKDERAAMPKSHQARKVRDYIDVLKNGQVHDIINCYSSVCDLTHPGASSVSMWFHNYSDLEMCLKTGQDNSLISDFLKDYRKTILELLMFAFNPAIVALRVLNYFPLAKFHTPMLDQLNLSDLQMWQVCQAALGELKPKTGAHLRIVKSPPPPKTTRRD